MTAESQLAAGRRAPSHPRRKIGAYVYILQLVSPFPLVPLDAPSKTASLHSPMRRFLPLLSLLLLATWLPATEHCALEAAGFFAETCPDGCAGTPGEKPVCPRRRRVLRLMASSPKAPAELCLWRAQPWPLGPCASP